MARDLGRIHAGSDISWTARCNGCDWQDRRPGISKRAMTRNARAHVAQETTHTVELTGQTWQLVFGRDWNR